MNYDYKCTSCKREVVINHSMKEDFRTFCTSCSSDSLVRYITTAPKFSFKGEGWASKDIRANSLK